MRVPCQKLSLLPARPTRVVSDALTSSPSSTKRAVVAWADPLAKDRLVIKKAQTTIRMPRCYPRTLWRGNWWVEEMLRAALERGFQVVEQVLHVFDAHRQANEPVGDAE